MRASQPLCVLLLFCMFVAAACSSDSSLGRSEKQQLAEMVKTVEAMELDLIYFHRTHTQYFEAMNEMVSDGYWSSIGNEIVFGYDGVTYAREDLAKMPQAEYELHKEHMLRLIQGIGMDQLTATVRISEVYPGDQPHRLTIYTVEEKELKAHPFTTTTKKYALEKQSGTWLITGVEKDTFTYGSEQTAAQVEEGRKRLSHQTHDGQDIGYPSVFVWSAAERE